MLWQSTSCGNPYRWNRDMQIGGRRCCKAARRKPCVVHGTVGNGILRPDFGFSASATVNNQTDAFVQTGGVRDLRAARQGHENVVIPRDFVERLPILVEGLIRWSRVPGPAYLIK